MNPDDSFPFSYDCCQLCPRRCRVNRRHSQGFCRSGVNPKVARAALHHWEEPAISGLNGSGAVFFSGCSLGCCFCQNHQISQEGFGQEVTCQELGHIFLRLQAQGAHNINLVTATHYLPSVTEALKLVRPALSIPVVYNCGGYEDPQIIEALKPYVNIWLPDLKYSDPALSFRYSRAGDYFSWASRAITQMIRQTGEPVFDDKGVMMSGVIIRHMVLPGARQDSIRLLQWLAQTLPRSQYYIGLLSQYTPSHLGSGTGTFPELNRGVTSYEYEKVVDTAVELGLTNGYTQKKSSAKEEYTPPFDLEGVTH